MFDENIWDEDKWEAFLRENDRRADRFMEYLFHFLRDYPQPDESQSDELKQWERRLDAYLSRKMGWDRGVDHLPFWIPEPDDEEETDQFARLLKEHNVEELPLFTSAKMLSRTALSWSESLPGEAKDSTLVHYCTCVMQIATLIARGHSLGFDRHTIGGNIAISKRALQAANVALDLLKEMEASAYLDEATYQHLYEDTYELRNGIGIYIQDLRDKSELGID